MLTTIRQHHMIRWRFVSRNLYLHQLINQLLCVFISRSHIYLMISEESGIYSSHLSAQFIQYCTDFIIQEMSHFRFRFLSHLYQLFLQLSILCCDFFYLDEDKYLIDLLTTHLNQDQIYWTDILLRSGRLLGFDEWLTSYK